MRWVGVLCVLLLSGCATPGTDNTATDKDTAPCPGHFHITLLVADGEEVLPYFTPGLDQDASGPVAGIHMHDDDGLIHIHPPQETCYSLASALHAVGVQFLPGRGIEVDGVVREGEVRLEVQTWRKAWHTWGLDERHDTVPNAARVLLMVNAPADISGLREQVPEIPENYRP